MWQAKTAEMLLNDCKLYVRMLDKQYEGMTAEDYFDAGQCKGLIEGAQDTMTLSRDLFRGARDLPIFCAHHKVSTGTQGRAIVAYGNAHPELEKYNAQTLVAWALAEAYPCPAGEWVDKPGVCEAGDENCG